MKHTESPWEVALDSRSKAVIVHHQGKSIATVRGKNAENDAILIAAVPDLLEALETIANWKDHSPKLAVNFGSNGVRDYYRNIAKAVIAKANGESHEKTDCS